ncbi:YggT family protein [Martelella alba]|uniref:YggT family protein n=1 Tax=Martelella alba TaxID=2590451 RepID=A0A506U921_9HYPH|nr:MULTISPECIES: YggT family protein [Martelella]TPW30863.1 YggT family protein [Martelella alba]
MFALFKTIDLVLNLYTWIIIASAILSWLYAFNIVNASNGFINTVGRMLYNLTEPVYRPIRNILPNLGGIDISPVIVLIAIYFIRVLMWSSIWPIFARMG